MTYGEQGDPHAQFRERIAELEEEVKRLRAALAEAMCVRHYCDMEGDPDDDADPYRHDEYLQRWAKALGRKVFSDWPTPGREKAAGAAGGGG